MNLTKICFFGILLVVVVFALSEAEPRSRRRNQRRRRSQRRRTRNQNKKRAAQVRQTFENAKEVVPGFFALTEMESLNFTSIQNEVSAPSCVNNLTLPRFAACKMQELREIIRNQTCVLEKSDENRVKRQRQNADGSETRIRSIDNQGSIVSGTKVRLCTEMRARTTLAQNRYPQVINEIICKNNERCLGDPKCFCAQQFIMVQFRIDTNEYGIDRLGEWDTYDQVIRTGCKCRVDKQSITYRLFIDDEN